MQRVHSYYCHLNLERRDLRAATQRSACLQSNSACCQNRAPPEFRGAKPHGNSAKIILFFQIPLLGQEIHRGDRQIFRKQGRNGHSHTGRSRRRAANDPPADVQQREPYHIGATVEGTRMITVRSVATGYYPIGYKPSKITATSPGRGAATRYAPSAGGCG